MKEVAIFGRHGFIGSALEKELIKREYEVSSFPTPGVEAIFHLAFPTHLPYEKNVDWHTREMISSMLYLMPFCRDNDIKLMWPSSALVYEDEKQTPFKHLKRVIEEMQLIYSDTNILSMRIFPVYGVGENVTAISQWVEAMKKGERPVIYGNGEQTRDFIYIDDVVDTMIDLMENDVKGIVDIGAGKSISFNRIVEVINGVLGTDIVPSYIKRPKGYSKGIECLNPVKTKVSIEEGIRRMV
jgi:nucleoside-diphosphate-sugar epimerase